MTMPTLIVEVGFTAALTGTALHLDDAARGILDTDTLASGDLFTDVTEWVTSVNTRRGATRADGPTLRYEAGTCTITFRNDDRRFDPTDLSGPYVAGGVTQVEPLRAVRIRASYGGQTWPLWRGFTDQWSVAYDGPNTSTASVTCFDAFGVFSAHNRNALAAVGAGETTSARVGRILDSIGWPSGDRMIATGEETVQATTLADNVLTEMLLTADTEMGDLFMDAAGRVRFRARSAGFTTTRSAYPQALFGDQVDDGVDTTANLVSNPSLETGTTGWGAGGGVGAPTLSQSSTRAMFGSFSLLGTWATGGFFPNVNYPITGLTVGKTYTISVYVYVPTGSPRIDSIVAGTDQFGTSSTVFDAWERLTWTGAASSTSMEIQLWPQGTATAGQQVWVDGLQVEEGDTATDYVDGTQTLGEWDGVAHASTSRRLPELPYANAELAYDALSITNTYQVTRAGGTEQTATDAGSVSAYLTRSYQRSDLLMQTDAEALMWAEQLLARTALPELRVASLQLKASRDADRLWPQVFGREIGDRLRVVKRPPGGGDPIEREAWVRGVEHRLPANLDWETTLILEQARDVVAVTDTFTRTVPTPLNANPFLETNASNWTALGGTVARSTAQFHEGVASLLLTPDGVTASVEARAELVPVTAGLQYRASAWVRCAVARTVNVNVNWHNSVGTILSTSTTSVAVAANTWTLIDATLTAPVGASQARLVAGNMTGTPPASNTLHIDEAMLQTDDGGWGDADTGDTWLLVGTSAAFSVGSGLGKHSLTAVNVSRWSLVGQYTNVHLSATVATSALAAGGSQYVALAARSTDDGATCYLARLDFTTTAGVALTVRKRVAGAETQLATFTTGLTHVAGTRYGVTFEAVGSTVRARVWLASSTEPTTWHVATTDASVTTAGRAGVRSILASSNTNTLPVTADYDSFTATTMHAWA